MTVDHSVQISKRLTCQKCPKAGRGVGFGMQQLNKRCKGKMTIAQADKVVNKYYNLAANALDDFDNMAPALGRAADQKWIMKRIATLEKQLAKIVADEEKCGFTDKGIANIIRFVDYHIKRTEDSLHKRLNRWGAERPARAPRAAPRKKAPAPRPAAPRLAARPAAGSAVPKRPVSRIPKRPVARPAAPKRPVGGKTVKDFEKVFKKIHSMTFNNAGFDFSNAIGIMGDDEDGDEDHEMRDKVETIHELISEGAEPSEEMSLKDYKGFRNELLAALKEFIDQNPDLHKLEEVRKMVSLLRGLK